MTLIKIIREHKLITILLAVALVATISTGAVFFRTGGDNLPLFFLFITAVIWLYVQFRIFMKILNRYAWANPVTKRISRIISGLFGLLFTFLGAIFAPVARRLQRIQLPRWRETNRLTLFQDEKIRLLADKRRNPFRVMKWKSLLNHRERIRFIYISYLQRKIKKGAIVLPSDTPNELNIKLSAGDDLSARLFSLYNVARYAGDDAIVEKEEVETVLPCASKRLKI